MKWKKEKINGTTWFEYNWKAIVDKKEVTVMAIKEYDKGIFVLPHYAFNSSKVRSLDKAKTMCEKWWSKLLKQNPKLNPSKA